MSLRALRARPLASRRPVLAALVGLTVVVSACGDDPATGAGGEALEVDDDDRARYDLVVEAHDIKFDAKEYAVAAGPLDVAYIEEGDLQHNLVIQDADGSAIPITGGDRDGKLVVTTRSDAEGTVTLVPGSYTLICTITGHADAGMKATLTVG